MLQASAIEGSEDQQCVGDDLEASDKDGGDQREGDSSQLNTATTTDPASEARVQAEIKVVGKMKLKAIKDELRRRNVYDADETAPKKYGKKHEAALSLARLRVAAALEREKFQAGDESRRTAMIDDSDDDDDVTMPAWFTESMVHASG